VGSSLGQYLLERLLGQGGMGAVYAARHRDLGRTVALKVLHQEDEQSEQGRQRFLREGQAASRIRHRNVVDLYDAGADAGRAFLVMELLSGEDLRRLLQREKILSVERACDLLVPVAAGLAAAHELGIVHRDLKPDNIFLSSERTNVTPKLLDFGISKVNELDATGFLTSTGALLGTPIYMSPEQAQSKKNVDARCDQYSLGVILYECVTGRRPVEEAALYRLMQRIVDGDYPAPRQLNPSLPSAFEQVLQRAMARDPEQRFPDIRALGEALLPFAGDRVRADYGQEFVHGGAALAPLPVAPVLRHQEPGGTTLRESVQLREGSRQAPRGRRAMLVGLGALASGLTAVVAWQALTTARPEPSSSPSASATSTEAQPLQPPPPVSEAVPLPQERVAHPGDAGAARAVEAAPPLTPATFPVGAAPARASRAPRPSSAAAARSTKRRAPKIDPFADQK
jgi:serine/threonine-protein kinase